jgi:hypothetical protein
MSAALPLEGYVDINAKCEDVYRVIVDAITVTKFSLMERNDPEFYMHLKIKGGMTRNVRGDLIDVQVEQYDAHVSRIFISVRGMRSLDSVRGKDLNELINIFSSACRGIETSAAADATESNDVPTLMALVESSNTAAAESSVQKLIEIAQGHQDSGNQVEALLILAPLASKYCIPAIDALIRIAAEKGDMAGLESWSAKKAEAEGIVKSGHGSPVAGVQKSYLPQLAALGLVATNLNLMRINNEIGDMGDTVAEGFDSISDLF